MTKVAIIGAGESGVGAAILAQKLGMECWVSDLGKIKAKYREILEARQIPFEEGQHNEDFIMACDFMVKSPGIPDKAPLIKRYSESGKEVISEIEFAYRHNSGKIIAVTGSNGKTTTSTLLYEMLKHANFNVGLAGNIGQSFALQVAESPKEYYVLELSSFQLDGIVHFSPDIAILLNITPDHLDRYPNMDAYVASKMRIAMNQTKDQAFVYNAQDPLIMASLPKHPGKGKNYPIAIGAYKAEPLAAETNENYLTINIKDPLTMSIHELALQGKHNLFNSMAAGVAGRILEIRKELVRDSLTHFESIEHRLEFVAKISGITFINDSKATNINSTWYALESQDKPIIWIVGGVDKGNDYTELYEMVEEKVKAIICLGVDNSKLHRAFNGRVAHIVDASSAKEAVQLAYDLGVQDDTVLLSPACASFDLFENYEDRGQQFKAAVKSL